jgi:hypothetical protein
MAGDVVCTIRFTSDEDFTYQDSLIRQGDRPDPPVVGKIDHGSLSWETAMLLGSWMREDGDRARDKEIRLLGRHLYELLFGGGIGQLFRAAYRNGTNKFRIELHFGPRALDVADLPWEFLFLPSDTGGIFLAGQRDEIVLTRVAMSSDDLDAGLATAQRPLRILVASLSPTTDVEPVVSKVAELGRSDPVEVTALKDPTFDELYETINGRCRPHVLHLVGHGEERGLQMRRTPDPGAAALAEASRLAGVATPDGDRILVLADTIKSLFNEYQPYLVFLHSCDGAANLRAVYSTARTIVYSSVPAVVAMQYKIEAGDASRFVGTFYRVLADGRSVGEAVSAGRRELAKGSETGVTKQDWSTRLFGTPVVYLRRDLPLVSRPLPSASRAPLADQRACSNCGMAASAEARFCLSCGNPIAPAMRPVLGGIGGRPDRWSVSGYRDVTI